MCRLICLLGLVVGALSVASLTGCGQSSSGIDSALLAKHRVRLTLAEEPDGAQVVPEVRNALLGISDDHAGHDHGDHAEHDHADHETEHADEEGHDHADHEDGDEDSGEGDDDEGDDNEGDDEEDADEEGDQEHEDDELDHDEHAEHDHEEGEHDEDGHDEHADHDDHEGHDHGATVVIKATEPMEVVLAGQIGGLTNPWQETQPDFPFARNQAAFFLADPLTVVENEESGHDHAPGEECAFCAAHAADRSAMLAMVRFLDEKGDVLRMDVQQLFDVKEGDTVVVQGAARVIEGGMMVVDATGLYIRQ